MHTERVGAGAALLAPADDDKMAHFCQLRTERLRSPPLPPPAHCCTQLQFGGRVLQSVLQTAAGWAGDCRHPGPGHKAGTGQGAWRHRADTWKPSPLQTQRNVSSEVYALRGETLRQV